MFKSAIFVCVIAVPLYFYFGRDSFPVKKPLDLNPQYDFIIVGAGSAGSAIASKLAEKYSVLVLEAGGDGSSPFYARWPAFTPLLQNNETSYAYETAPLEDLAGRKLRYPRGKGLGGTANINFMIANIGSRTDYDSNPAGWRWDDFAPYLQDLLKTSTVLSPRVPLFEQLVNSEDDYNDVGVVKDAGGTSWHRTSYFINPSGLRTTTAISHLLPAARNWPHMLHVLTGAHVLKINVDGVSKRAVGVTYWHGAKQHRVLVNFDVIVCAGAIDTPKLLMLSGIGPKNELTKHGIPTVTDSPNVGSNLFDHSMFMINYWHNDSAAVLNADALVNRPVEAIWHLAKYLVYGTGVVATSGVPIIGFATSKTAKLNGMKRDIEYYSFMVDTLCDGYFKHLVDFSDEVHESSRVFPPGSSVIAVAASLNRPKSRGSVRLRSADPFDVPDIKPEYLTNKDDFDALVDGIVSLVAQMRDIYGDKLTLAEKPLAACAHEQFLSPSYWRCVLPHRLLTVYHPAGTAAMGATGESVLDERLRVRGISGLRVVDMSALPSPMGANPHAPAVALGLLAGDKILLEMSERRAE